jgi:hypothetical protein
MCILAIAIHYGPKTKTGLFPPRKATTPRGELVTFWVGQPVLVPILLDSTKCHIFLAIDTC